MKKIIVSILCFTLISSSFAVDIQVGGLQGLNMDTKEAVNAIIKRNIISGVRPAACPLNSVGNMDILGKINNIKTLFNNSCLDKNQERLASILGGAEQIQASLDEFNTQTQQNQNQTQTQDVQQSQSDTTINGEQIATVVNGLNNIFRGNSCDSLNKDQNFLQQSSTILSEIAKIGLVTNSTNGLIVSAGGFALSSVLTAIDSIFQKRFDFRKSESRQTFIKLNCAFYDIRRDIQNAGFLDVATPAHNSDLKLANELKAKINNDLAKLNSRHQEILKMFTDEELVKEESKLQELKTYKANLLKAFNYIKNSQKTNKADQLRLINGTTWDLINIKQKLNLYLDLDIPHIGIFNNSFESLLIQIDFNNVSEFNSLISMNSNSFFSDYIQNLSFHLERVVTDITKYEQEWVSKRKSNLSVNSENYKAYLAKLNSEKTEKETEANKLINELDKVILRLSRITGNDSFTRHDDGSENIVSILSDYDSIARQVYGVHGLNFISSMVGWSLHENNDFTKNYNQFAENFAIPYGVDISEMPFSEYEKQNICQSAMPLRRSWNYANSLAEQAYNFVATNVDIFQGSSKSHKYLGSLENVDDKSRRRLSTRDKILYHEKSAQVAKMSMSGIEVPYQAQQALLNNSWLGDAMVRLERTKVNAGFIQNVIEAFNCTEILEMK